MGNLNLKHLLKMTDTYEFKLDATTPVCWADLKEFSDAKCATEAASQTLPKTMTNLKFVDLFYLAECTGTSFTVQGGADMEKAKLADKIKVECTGWNAKGTDPAKWFTMTASGYQVVKKTDDTKKDETTTGATSMAAAFAAGALAVAATQF